MRRNNNSEQLYNNCCANQKLNWNELRKNALNIGDKIRIIKK